MFKIEFEILKLIEEQYAKVQLSKTSVYGVYLLD